MAPGRPSLHAILKKFSTRLAVRFQRGDHDCRSLPMRKLRRAHLAKPRRTIARGGLFEGWLSLSWLRKRSVRKRPVWATHGPMIDPCRWLVDRFLSGREASKAAATYGGLELSAPRCPCRHLSIGNRQRHAPAVASAQNVDMFPFRNQLACFAEHPVSHASLGHVREEFGRR